MNKCGLVDFPVGAPRYIAQNKMADARFEISFVTCTTDRVLFHQIQCKYVLIFLYPSTSIQLSHQLYPSTTKYHRESVSVLYAEEFKGHGIDRNY